MDGAKVKSETGARFAIKPDDSGETPKADNSADDGMTLRGFAVWSFLAGAVGLVWWFFADLSAVWSPVLFLSSALLLLYGGILLWHTGQYNKMVNHAIGLRRKAEKQATQAAEDLSDTKRASEDNIAKIQSAHQKELAAKNKEMKTRESEAADKYGELESEKRGMEREKNALALTLAAARETLSYYSDRAQIDVYEGKDAQRECGGVYVISNAADGKVKIGHTGNFADRFSQIQSQCRSSGIKDITPVVLVPVDEGRYEIEQSIHAALEESNTAGEWFEIAPEEAVAVVLEHVHKRRVSNFEERTKLPVPKEGGE